MVCVFKPKEKGIHNMDFVLRKYVFGFGPYPSYQASIHCQAIMMMASFKCYKKLPELDPPMTQLSGSSYEGADQTGPMGKLVCVIVVRIKQRQVVSRNVAHDMR